MLKNPLTDAYSNIQEDEQQEEKHSSGILIWTVWTVMTVLAVTILTVSIISLIFFNIKMKSTYQTFQQSTLMLAPTVFNLDSSRLPPPCPYTGIDWGVMDTLLVGSMDKDNNYIEVDSNATHSHYMQSGLKEQPPQSRDHYEMGYVLKNSSIGIVEYLIQAKPTFSISGLKNLLMKINNYPNIPVDQPVRPVILQHVAYQNVKHVADSDECFDMCYNQNCQVSERFIASGLRSFSVIGWNDNIRSLGMVDRLTGTNKIFEGGFIVRLPKQETGHTIGYFTANFSDTMENSICPNAHLVQNWEPAIVTGELFKEEHPVTSVLSEIHPTNSKQFIYSNLNRKGIKQKTSPTPLKLRDNICKDKNDYCTKYNLNESFTYYITSSENSYPKFVKTFGNDIYDLCMGYCPHHNFTDCKVYVLRELCDELLVKIFVPTDDYMKTHQNGLECSYTLLPYETLLRMNLLIRPTKVNKLGNSYMSFDFSFYDSKLKTNLPDVQRTKYNQRLKFTDLLFFTSN
ncbi:hypothetical protein ENUP19_0085G0040 [Entamoeba nuttalli]|uniref:Uncharacterized protein n=1 Tax=Entamoeba nuttalli TaxID=412467 RepID=A0ABQ0DGF7_9EUKA